MEQEIISFEDELEYLSMSGCIDRRNPVLLAVNDAASLIQRGMQHFVGEKAQWLPEYDEVAAWLEGNEGRGLLCAGNVGRGKTVLCGQVLPCIIHWWARLMVCGYSARELASRYDEASRKRLLFVDDIGTEGAAMVYGTRVDAIPALIDDAERQGKLLLLTTNLSFDELQGKYGERTTDRLRDICKVVVFQGGSLRR